ncbi:MAG TPA: hypothetical protein VLR26_01960 [Frankiaceae bacterium]|nr:hypothetical protein [Frankiaceae bacterium]
MAGLAVGLFFLVFFAAMIGGLVFWIMKIVEVAQIPEPQYRAAGTDKTVWVLVVVLVGWVGALIWQFAKREDVLRARGLLGAGPGGPGPGGFGYGPGPVGIGYSGGSGYPGGPGYAQPPTTPAGWYPEPGTGWFAYWDGYRWTGARQPPQQPTRALPDDPHPQQHGPSLEKRPD